MDKEVNLFKGSVHIILRFIKYPFEPKIDASIHLARWELGCTNLTWWPCQRGASLATFPSFSKLWPTKQRKEERRPLRWMSVRMQAGHTYTEAQQKSSAATQTILTSAFITNLFSNLIPERGQKLRGHYPLNCKLHDVTIKPLHYFHILLVLEQFLSPQNTFKCY